MINSFIGRIVDKVKRPRSLSRFMLIGVFNTMVGVTLFPLLFWVFGTIVSFNVLLALSYILCTLSSFLLHKYKTFESHGGVVGEGIKFAILSFITYLLNLLLLHLILPISPMHPVVTQTIIAVALQLGNYLGMNRLVFSSLSSMQMLRQWFQNTPNR